MAWSVGDYRVRRDELRLMAELGQCYCKHCGQDHAVGIEVS